MKISNYKHLKDDSPYWIIKIDEIIEYVRKEKGEASCQLAEYYRKFEKEGH